MPIFQPLCGSNKIMSASLEVLVHESNFVMPVISKSGSEPRLSKQASRATRKYLPKPVHNLSTSCSTLLEGSSPGRANRMPSSKAMPEPTPSYEDACSIAVTSSLDELPHLPSSKVWKHAAVRAGSWGVTVGRAPNPEIPKLPLLRAEVLGPNVEAFLIRYDLSDAIRETRQERQTAAPEPKTVAEEKELYRKNPNMRKPRLVDLLPKGWSLHREELLAGANWDARYKQQCALAERHCFDADVHEDDVEEQFKFKRALFEMQHTRCYPPRSKDIFDGFALRRGEGVAKLPKREGAPNSGDEAAKQRTGAPNSGDEAAKQRTKFDPNTSIWAPRRDWADSKNLIDTDDVYRKRFKIDWEWCVQMGASKTIVAYDDDGFVDTDGDGIPDEVTEVENVLWQNYRIISNLYNYFASVEGSPHFLSVVGFNAFLDHFALVQKRSRFCTRSDFEMLVEAVQASSAQVHSKWSDVHSHLSILSLHRSEFLLAIIRIAINMYVRPKVIPDVSEAVQRLLEVDITARASPTIFASPTAHRRNHFYSEATCLELRRHESTLRALYLTLSCSDAEQGTAERKLINLEEWMSGMDALCLIGIDVTKRKARLAFIWSRMMVIDSGVAHRTGLRNETHLPFEGFLEALCHVAALKALPTDARLEAVGAQNAAAFLEKLRVEEEKGLHSEYSFFINENSRREWGSEPPQPVHRCLAHLMSLIILTVKAEQPPRGPGAPDPNPNALSQDEVDRWASAHIPAVAAFCEQRAKDRLAAAVAAAEKALEESLKAERTA